MCSSVYHAPVSDNFYVSSGQNLQGMLTFDHEHLGS